MASSPADAADFLRPHGYGLPVPVPGVLPGPLPAPAPLPVYPEEEPPAPRYFPRGGGEDTFGTATALPRPVGCRPRRVPVPTNAPDDPSYVGSAYGLSKPSYYGFTPPLGVDDPYGRPTLPYCR